MAADKKLAKELAALRAELDALKAAQDTGAAAPAGESAADTTAIAGEAAALFGAQVPEQLRDFEKAIKDLAETVEHDIAERPVAAVGAAFLLGILIGRLSAR